ISCHSTATASLNAFANGGKPPLKYLWSTGQTASTINGLMAGTYLLTVTDASGTVTTASFSISEPDPISVVVTADAIASSGGIDGKATAKVTGGSAPYQYNWDNGEKSNKAVKLAAGNHIVSILDAMGCTTTGVVDISENILALEVSITQKSKILCAGSLDANIEATVKGGKAPFAYKWNASSSSASLPNIGLGLYTLTVTDATGHTATSVITVDSPQPLKVDVKIDAPASTGGADGKATSTASGGTGRYTYVWDNNEKTAKAEKLAAGTHRLTVTDENGCTTVTNVDIAENILPLVIKINQDKKIKCNGQQEASLKSDVTGGKQPYTYLWSGAGKQGKGESINDLPAGMYTLSITDATGAAVTKQYEVTEPKALKVTLDNMLPASTGNADGEATISVAGGTPPYSATNIASPSGSTSFKANKLSPGIHQVTVTDAAGCTAEIVISIPENILQLTTSIHQTKEILCNSNSDAAIEGTVRGGKPPYTYAWNTGQTTTNLSNLAAGNYTLNVTDASGQKSSAELKVIAPASMILEIENLRSATNDRISDGKGTIQVKYGTPPYTFVWGSGETTAQASKLKAGPGKVVVTDQNGCSASIDYVVNQKVLPELTAARLNSGEPIRMEKIQFAADSVKLDTAAMPSLDELYDFLYDNPTIIIEVSGHTNGLPADEYCDLISSERAKSVADYLISKGIEARRVISKGYGKRKPVASNQTPEGRKRNQRVEIRLIKIGE
ncbi:MAG: OmpA family protein, partial [Saprospiraceae bacterium]